MVVFFKGSWLWSFKMSGDFQKKRMMISKQIDIINFRKEKPKVKYTQFNSY